MEQMSYHGFEGSRFKVQGLRYRDRRREGQKVGSSQTFQPSYVPTFLTYLKNRNLQPGTVNSEPVNVYSISD